MPARASSAFAPATLATSSPSRQPFQVRPGPWSVPGPLRILTATAARTARASATRAVDDQYSQAEPIGPAPGSRRVPAIHHEALTGAISPKAGAGCPDRIAETAAPAHNAKTTPEAPMTVQTNLRSFPATAAFGSHTRPTSAGYTRQRSQPPPGRFTADTRMAMVGEWTRSPRCGHHLFMAKTTIIQITDDLDGSKDAKEVSFSFQGADYTIDLSKKT